MVEEDREKAGGEAGDGDGGGAGDRPDHPAEGTRPPGNPGPSEDAVREAADKLEQAGGGH